MDPGRHDAPLVGRSKERERTVRKLDKVQHVDLAPRMRGGSGPCEESGYGLVHPLLRPHEDGVNAIRRNVVAAERAVVFAAAMPQNEQSVP